MSTEKREVRDRRGRDRSSSPKRCAGGSLRGQCGASQDRRRGERKPLNADAKESLKLLARLVARCGLSLEEASATFSAECRRIPRKVGRDVRIDDARAREAAQIITLWYTESEYLNARGRPIPVPLLGAAPSMEALARRVNPTLAVTDALVHLNAARVLRKVEGLYVPCRRYVSHKPNTPAQNAHSLRVVAGLLRTTARNAKPRVNGDQRWFEGAAAGSISKRKRISTMRELEPAAHGFLQLVDAFLVKEAPDSKDVATVPLFVEVVMFEGRSQGNSRPQSGPAVSGATTRAAMNGKPSVAKRRHPVRATPATAGPVRDTTHGRESHVATTL